MNIAPKKGVHPFLLLPLLLLLSGCLASTKTATLYSLKPIEQPPLAAQSPVLGDMILVMPVRVAPHLQSRSILYQQTSGETRAAASHLWSASLDKQIAQEVTTNLQELLASPNIALFPGPRYGSARYQVEIEVQQFNGDAQVFSTLATYTLSDKVTQTILVRKNFRQKRSIDNPGYSGYVETASRAVADLSREVAVTLLRIGTSHSTP